MQIKPDSSVTHNNFQGGECQTRGAEIHGLTPDFWPASQNQLQRHFWCGILASSCRNLLFAWEQSQPCKEKPFSHWCGQRDLGNHHKIWGCLSSSWNPWDWEWCPAAFSRSSACMGRLAQLEFTESRGGSTGTNHRTGIPSWRNDLQKQSSAQSRHCAEVLASRRHRENSLGSRGEENRKSL